MPEPDIEPIVEEPVPETESPAVEAAQADNSAQSEDSVLDRLLGFDQPEPRRAVPASETTAPADPDVDRALKALRRDGVPPEVIASISSDPSKLKEWGLKAAKRQADVDAFGAKVAESRKTDKTDEDAASAPEASISSDDGESDADPLSEFGKIFGDEATKPIRSLADRLRAEFDQKSKALEARYETDMAYREIAREYGANAPSFDEITEAAAKIGRDNPGSFDSVRDIVRQAFRSKAGEPKRIDPRNVARPTVGKQPARAVRQIDKDDAALDILLSGGSRDDVHRFLSR